MKAGFVAAVEKLDEIQLRILTQYAEGLVEENELRAKLQKS
jgi:hypothetical protein